MSDELYDRLKISEAKLYEQEKINSNLLLECDLANCRAERAENMVERLIEARKQLIAQLAAEKDKNEHMLDCIFEYETIAPDGQLGVSLLNMDNHIRSLEADNAELKEQLVIANELIERLK